MAFPDNAHPIYQLRRNLIFIDLVGIIVLLLFINIYTPASDEIALPILLAISAIFTAIDLACYTAKKATSPDQDPPWPSNLWIVGDAVLAILLQCGFWGAIVGLDSSYYNTGEIILGAYGALACFFASVVHACCFWKEVAAFYEKKWLARLVRQPCARCGYLQQSSWHAYRHMATSMPTTRTMGTSPSTVTYVGPSAGHQRPSVRTPESQDSAMEEGLLIDPDFGAAGYGTDIHPDRALEQSDEIMAGGRGKRKAGRSTRVKDSTLASDCCVHGATSIGPDTVKQSLHT